VRERWKTYKGEGKGAKRRERGRKGAERRRKRKGKGGKERRCAVGIFNYFRLCNIELREHRPMANMRHYSGH